jgi:outer membrane receptor protein involved in Fe transport
MTFRALLLGVLLAGSSLAQFSSGALSGEIRDESGAAVTAAPVVARQTATGFSRTVVSNSTGQYVIPDLPPGEYSITVTKTGFRTVTVDHVAVEVDHPLHVGFDLKIGAERDSVTVNAIASPLQTADATGGFFAGTSFIEDLPLDGRNIVSLVTLGPGPAPRQLNGFGHDVVNDKQAARGAVALNSPVNGAKPTMNTYLLDGEYNTDRNTFSIAVVPPLESVQEFRIETSVGSAQFAQSGGGVVDLVTKSGSQTVHGNLFEFLRNEATDAHSYFDDPTLPRSIFRQNQFGGTIGGPVPHLKNTYFFAAYEGLVGQNAKATVHLVPDAAVRNGDFTGRNQIFDPASYDPVTNSRNPFPNNMIPLNRIDPLAKQFLQTYEPSPNQPDNGTSNFLDATPNQNHNNSGSLRVDHQFSGNNVLFARYTINDDRAIQAGNFPQRPNTEDLRAQQAAVGFTHAGSAWLSDARLSFTRLNVSDLPIGSTGLPVFAITDFDTVTDSDLVPQTQRDNTWSASEGITVTRGRHTLRFGFQFIHFQLNYLASIFPRGQFVFNGTYTSNLASPNTGDAFADFLLGDAVSTQRNGSAQAYLRQNSYASYFQDEWRPTDKLTLTLGVRYEYASPYSETRNNLLNLDYSNLPQAPSLVHVSQAGQPNRLNFSPRVGLAWRIANSLVFRAGYGIFYSPEIATEAYDLVRNNVLNQINQTSGPVPILTLQNGFPSNASAGQPSYFGLDPKAGTPYVQQWNGGFQKELHGGVLLDVSYIGSKGTHLGRFRTFNTPAHVETGEDLAPRPGDLQSLRTFPELGPIIQRQHIANSSYNSLQIKSEKRLSGGLTFLASFVWSKSIDDADTVIPGFGDSVGAQDERNLRLERGPSVFNTGRRLSVGFAYKIPAPPVLRTLLAHWSTSGIFTLQDGMPENPIYFGTDFANSGTPNRPNVVLGQSLNLPTSQRTAQQWFNVNAFSDPAPFTFGDAGRNILPTPGTEVFDLALQRRFELTERVGLQLRLESFNLLNHPNWGIPGQYPDFGPFFGKIFASGEPRRFQFGLKLEF